MTPKQFAVLAATAGLSLFAAAAVYSARTTWTSADAGTGKLFPALHGEVESIARVHVTQGESTVTLEKSGDAWVMKSHDGYPASTEKVRTLLASLTDATLLEPKTRIKTRYTVLDVDDPLSATSNARLVKVETESGETAGEVIVGKSRASRVGGPGAGAPGTYVRRPTEEQSWLASTAITGSASLKDWATVRVFETDAGKVSLVTVELEGEQPYEIKRAEDKSHTLTNVPDGKKIKYVNLVDNLVEAAAFLDFLSVRKATGAQGGTAGKVRLDIDDGLKVTLSVRRDKDATWATVEAIGEGAGKPRAEEIAARTHGWEFEILPSKVDTMLKKHADLLEDAAS